MDSRIQRQSEMKTQSQALYSRVKQYVEESYDRVFREVEEEKSVRNPKLTSDDFVLLSDELAEGSEEEAAAAVPLNEGEKPGNAQHLETPRVQQ